VGLIKVGALGEGIRGTVRNLLSDSNIRSELTLTPVTVTTGSCGGYEQNTEEEGTARTVYCVPSNYVKSKMITADLGELRTGEIRFLIRDDEDIAVTATDKVVFDSIIYEISEIRPIYFNEVTVAQSITLAREQ